MITRLGFVLIAVYGLAHGQDPRAADLGQKLGPSDAAVSCSVEPASRIVTVILTNHTDKRRYFQRSGPLTDYRAVVTDSNGKPLPQLTAMQGAKRLNPSGSLGSITLSSTLISIDPAESYTGSFPLFVHVTIPKDGGRFQIRVGQVLFSLPANPLESDPHEIVWCEPIDATFPRQR